MKFFKRILKSITDFDAYKEFYLETVGKSIRYLLKICLIICVIISFVITCKFIMPLGEFLKDEFPNFKYQNDELISEEQIYMDADFGLFVIDTNVNLENDEYANELKSQEICYMFFKDAFIIKADGMSITYNYKDLFTEEFSLEEDRDDQINAKLYLYVYFVLILILLSYYFIKALINILMLTIIIYITRRMLQINLSFSNIFNISIYGFTLPLVLELICTLLSILANFTVYNYDTMIIIIGYIYTLTALFNIRKGLNKLNIDYEEYQRKVNEEKENKE